MPLTIVHCKTLVPIERPLTEEFGELTEVIVDPPVITLQVPTPDVGVFAASIAVVEQMVVEGPALEMDGTGST